MLRGCPEADLWVGDRLRVGAAVLRVEAPRQPCYKFNAVLGYRHAVRDMVQSGHSGIYLSVLEAAPLQAGDTVQVTPGPREVLDRQHQSPAPGADRAVGPPRMRRDRRRLRLF